jgi:hypothetical protein
MIRLRYIAATAFLLTFAADNPQGLPWRASAAPPTSVFSGQSVPVLPIFAVPAGQDAKQQGTSASAASSATGGVDPAGSATPPVPVKTRKLDPNQPLDPSARMDLIRYLYGEFAKAKQSLPTGKDGYILKVGQPINNNTLAMELSRHGAAFSPGDRVQITAMRFRNREIVFDINGGGKEKINWRDRIQIQAIGVPTVSTTETGPEGQTEVRLGSTLVLDFGRPVPEMTPDELKADLAPVFEFSQRSAATQWIDTLPPEMQKAIAEKRPMIGMTHEMVVAAIGKAERIVRETQPDGTPTEDWIYGTPPAKTVFVTFVGDKVVKIEQFPQ